MIMIRLFYAFGKSLFSKSSDLTLFLEATQAFSSDAFLCPKCGRTHSCTELTPYPRYLISFDNSAVICHRINVRQVRCDSCASIHAVLPDCLIPHSSYSLPFILTVLRVHFLGANTVESLCLKYQISVSTLYAWIKQLYSHKHLWLGLLKNNEIPVSTFLLDILPTTFSTEQFFDTYNFSFLQYAFTTLYDSS